MCISTSSTAKYAKPCQGQGGLKTTHSIIIVASLPFPWSPLVTYFRSNSFLTKSLQGIVIIPGSGSFHFFSVASRPCSKLRGFQKLLCMCGYTLGFHLWHVLVHLLQVDWDVNQLFMSQLSIWSGGSKGWVFASLQVWHIGCAGKELAGRERLRWRLSLLPWIRKDNINKRIKYQ